jgi:hypothetical protein
MKVLLHPVLILLLVMILSSCTKIIFISRKTDPEINLENVHHDIVFANLFNYTLPVNVNKKDRFSYHAGVMNLLDGLSSFSSDSSFNFSVGDTLKKSVEAGDLTTLLSVDSINNICNRFNANLLLTLDSASIFFERDTVINHSYGVEYASLQFKLNTRFFMSLYSDTGDLIDRSEVDQSSVFIPRSIMSGRIIQVPYISRATEEIENLAFQAGQEYVGKFYPVIIHDTKQLFNGKAFKESNNYIFSRNWNKATELLEQLVKNQDPSIAEKARYNLEVVNEASEASVSDRK